LARASRPIVLAGDAVAQANALTELVRLAEQLGAPVYDEGVASRTAFPSTHPLYRGSFARLSPVIRGILQEHDLVLSIGADLFTLSLPGAVEALPEGIPIIHLDTDPWELGKNYPETISLLGNPKNTLPELCAALHTAMGPAVRARAAERLEAASEDGRASLAKLHASAEAVMDHTSIAPLALMHAVAQALPSDAVVIDETISSGAGLRRLLQSNDAQSFFGLRGGGIGWGLPAAIGVKLALPHRPVVALIGDGSALYTIQGLWTAARENVTVVFIIINNSSYRILKQRTNAMKAFAAQTDRYIGMDLDNPRIDFLSVAAGLGITAHRAATISDFRELLDHALKSNAPTLIDVEVDRNWKPV
ncbi:MAG: thiamine pyrophosphate-binding protein, partial [Acetobacteraceae bacterium]|nr:thiamine pyrophosphate-binding protein [Acetobacteraceae bacterium]